MTKPTIAATTQDDIQGLQTILDHTGLFPSDLLPDMIAPALSGESNASWLTCRVDGSPRGLCYTEPEELAEGSWNMLALAVHPEFQRHGIGAALVKATEEFLQQSNQRLLIVETSGTDGFAQARRFYEDNGYEQEARIRDFWAEGDDKIIFRKAL